MRNYAFTASLIPVMFGASSCNILRLIQNFHSNKCDIYLRDNFHHSYRPIPVQKGMLLQLDFSSQSRLIIIKFSSFFGYTIFWFLSVLQRQYNQYSMKKDFDTFSFKATSRKNRDSIRKEVDFEPTASVKNWREMSYRFQKNMSSSPAKNLTFQSNFINEKIYKIDEELTENIRRRIELEKKLYVQNREVKQKLNEQYFQNQQCKTKDQIIQTYVNMESKTNAVQSLLNRQYNPNQSYLELVEKNKRKSQNILATKQPKIQKYLVVDQIKMQKLLRKATFPQLPSSNLAILQQECQQVHLCSQHSDAVYLMMVVSFHLQKYHNVRKYFREIQMFKVFEPKAYWVACQTEYALQSYQICLKLADICMKQIEDKHLPRFVFLSARCYQKLGNFINSILCYNQLIKMKPKVAELHLERAIIYDKIGYSMEAKQDYIEYSTLEPQARQYLREKIQIQKNEIKRKQFIKALAKIS